MHSCHFFSPASFSFHISVSPQLPVLGEMPGGTWLLNPLDSLEAGSRSALEPAEFLGTCWLMIPKGHKEQERGEAFLGAKGACSQGWQTT